MSKYKLNHNINEQTCLSYYLVHTHRFSSRSSSLSCTVAITLCILYYERRKGWEARRRAKLGESSGVDKGGGKGGARKDHPCEKMKSKEKLRGGGDDYV